MIKSHSRCHYAIGARVLAHEARRSLVLAPGFEPRSRSNLELTGYKPAALPLCYAKKLALAAGVEPASFQLRFTPLEAETDTRARKFRIANFGFRIATLGSQNPHSEFRNSKFSDLAQAVGLEPTTFRLTGGHRQPSSVA
jgi:hypothetical protein